jgi:predicted amidohydrolase
MATDIARIRIAAAQYPPEALASLGAYRDKLARWVGEAAGAGAQLLVLPEYGAMEYAAAAGAGVVGDLVASLAAVSDALPEMDAAHAELARRHGVHILAASGPSARGGAGGTGVRYVNAARLFAPSGRSGTQEKLIMTPFERDWGVSGGATLRVFDTALGRIGIAICYDSEFPLLVRAMAEAGAEILLVPSCTEFASGWHRVRTAALARALESTCVTVLSPTVGDAPWSPAIDRNTGAAGIFVPADHSFSETGVLAEGEVNRPGWVYADVDLARLAELKASGEMRNAADWRLQPGAAALGRGVEVVDLR